MLETKRARGFFLLGLAVAAFVAFAAYSVVSAAALDREVDDTEAALESSLAGTNTSEVQALFDEASLGDLDASEELDGLLKVDGREPFVTLGEAGGIVARYEVTALGQRAVVEVRWSGDELEVHEVES